MECAWKMQVKPPTLVIFFVGLSLIVLKLSYDADQKNSVKGPGYKISSNYLWYISKEEEPNSLSVLQESKINLKQQHFTSLYNESRAISWSLKTVYGQMYRDVKDRFSRTVLPKNPEINSFISQRDSGWRNTSEGIKKGSRDQCENCAINAACYNASLNLWHPSKVIFVLKQIPSLKFF